MKLPYFGQDLYSKKKVLGILAHVWPSTVSNSKVIILYYYNQTSLVDAVCKASAIQVCWLIKFTVMKLVCDSDFSMRTNFTKLQCQNNLRAQYDCWNMTC